MVCPFLLDVRCEIGLKGSAKDQAVIFRSCRVRIWRKMGPLFENIAVIILAAGLGTRMKSQKAKVLHQVLGQPMILYVVDTATQVAGKDVILVVGHQVDQVRIVVSEHALAEYAYQERQLGTGHAVLCALPQVPAHSEHIVILCGDVPMITAETIRNLVDDHLDCERDITVLAVEIDKPAGYGRVLINADNQVTGIVEEADATDEEKKIRLINTGIYCVKKAFLAESLQKIDTDNAQGELYLTDIIAVGHREKKAVGALLAADEHEFYGINSKEDLGIVEGLMQRRRSGST